MMYFHDKPFSKDNFYQVGFSVDQLLKANQVYMNDFYDKVHVAYQRG